MKPGDNERAARIYFTDFFDVSPEVLASYGAFNVACIVDLPLFIDPFLLFTSSRPEYQALHNEVIHYLSFLRDKSVEGMVLLPRGQAESPRILLEWEQRPGSWNEFRLRLKRKS